MILKHCPGCDVDYPATAEFWPRNAKSKDGWAFYHKACHNAKGKESKDLHGGAANYHARRRYGITAADKQNKLKEQDGKCPICGTQLLMGERTTHVDHSHKTGRFRGVLCSSCNQGLGNFKDDPVRLAAAIVYLQATEGGE